MKKEKKIPFLKVIKALLDEENPFPARYLYRLSDIEEADYRLLEQTWTKLSSRRRQAVLEDIQQFSEDDFLLNYYAVGLLAVKDMDPLVRQKAVLTLSDYDEDDVLVPLFTYLAEADGNVDVRAAAAAALGGAVEQGELEKISHPLLKQAEDCLLRISQGQDGKVVRLRALESLGFSSRDEVPSLIKEAYQSHDSEWLAAALVAMGRSYDKKWAGDVLAALTDARPVVRQEAATAAGELELEDAKQVLLDLLTDTQVDVRQAAIWALSQIGGSDIRDILEKMLESTEDEEEADFIDSALENLEFTEGFAAFDFSNFSEEEMDLFLAEDEEDLDSDEESKAK